VSSFLAGPDASYVTGTTFNVHEGFGADGLGSPVQAKSRPDAVLMEGGPLPDRLLTIGLSGTPPAPIVNGLADRPISHRRVSLITPGRWLIDRTPQVGLVERRVSPVDRSQLGLYVGGTR
jgi:hypothetical protein